MARARTEEPIYVLDGVDFDDGLPVYWLHHTNILVKENALMNIKYVLPTLVLCMVLAACASPLAVNSDYDTTADFTAYKTYNWMPATGNAAGNELLIKHIRAAVDTQLQAKGRTLSEDNPDFLIGMVLSGKTTYGGSTGVGLSVGIPVGKRGSVSVGGGRSTAHESIEGTLVMDFVDARTKDLLWRSTATKAVNPSASTEEKQQHINDVVKSMLAQFPPKK
jgi:Domain of unknown function (DUF4136)